MLKDNQVLGHSSLQSTAFRVEAVRTFTSYYLHWQQFVGGVKPDTGCVRQFPGEALLLTNSPGEETV